MLQILALSFSYSQNHQLFDQLNMSWHRERCGLVGPNGCGKSTLLHLLSSRLEPSSGRVLGDERRRVLVPQVRTDSCEPIFSLLGEFAPLFLASLDITANGGTPENWDLVHGHWEAINEFTETLKHWVPGIEWDKPIASLSPGIAQRVQLAMAFAQHEALLLLDEPSNHLDRAGRELLRSAVAKHSSGMILASHDRELLEGVDRIIDFRSQPPRDYGGNYSFYSEQKRLDDEARLATRQALDRDYRKTRRAAQTMKERVEQRNSHGHRIRDKIGAPKIVIGMMKRNAENTAARIQKQHAERIEQLDAAKNRHSIRDLQKEALHLDLIGRSRGRAHELLRSQDVNHHYGDGRWLWSRSLYFSLEEGQRIAIAGNNGSGKSTLIALISGAAEPRQGSIVNRSRQLVHLGQMLECLPAGQTLAKVWEDGSAVYLGDESRRRTLAARFGLNAECIIQTFENLSGGQRMKAALVLLATRIEMPDLVILDEPSNHLDLDTLVSLTMTLRELRCALVVVSHDVRFLQDLGIEDIFDLNDYEPVA